MCTQSGAERSISHFSQGVSLVIAAILAANSGKQVDEKLHLNAKVLCAKFGLKSRDGLGGVGGHPYVHTDRQTYKHD